MLTERTGAAYIPAIKQAVMTPGHIPHKLNELVVPVMLPAELGVVTTAIHNGNGLIARLDQVRTAEEHGRRELHVLPRSHFPHLQVIVLSIAGRSPVDNHCPGPLDTSPDTSPLPRRHTGQVRHIAVNDLVEGSVIEASVRGVDEDEALNVYSGVMVVRNQPSHLNGDEAAEGPS